MLSTSNETSADTPQYTVLGENNRPKVDTVCSTVTSVQQLGPNSVLLTYTHGEIQPQLDEHFKKSLTAKSFAKKEHHPHVPASFWIRRHRRTNQRSAASSSAQAQYLPPPPPLPSTLHYNQPSSSKVKPYEFAQNPCSTNLLRSGFGWPSYSGGHTQQFNPFPNQIPANDFLANSSWTSGLTPSQSNLMGSSAGLRPVPSSSFSSWTPLGYTFSSPSIDSTATSYPHFAAGFEACGVTQPETMVPPPHWS